ncbi:hypothetical protein GT50_07830 [Geobacillus stearothermophilus 10]|nr:hypothetical protein GT50_07830 [Geobacillus stearothermophilus 10]
MSLAAFLRRWWATQSSPIRWKFLEDSQDKAMKPAILLDLSKHTLNVGFALAGFLFLFMIDRAPLRCTSYLEVVQAERCFLQAKSAEKCKKKIHRLASPRLRIPDRGKRTAGWGREGVSQAVVLSRKGQDVGMMNQAIDQSSCQAVVVPKHPIPLSKFQIRRHDDAVSLITVGDHMKPHISHPNKVETKDFLFRFSE